MDQKKQDFAKTGKYMCKRRPDQSWARCDDCFQWRKLTDGIDCHLLPDSWFCRINPDPEFRSCITGKNYDQTYLKERAESHKRNQQAAVPTTLAACSLSTSPALLTSTALSTPLRMKITLGPNAECVTKRQRVNDSLQNNLITTTMPVTINPVIIYVDDITDDNNIVRLTTKRDTPSSGPQSVGPLSDDITDDDDIVILETSSTPIPKKPTFDLAKLKSESPAGKTLTGNGNIETNCIVTSSMNTATTATNSSAAITSSGLVSIAIQTDIRKEVKDEKEEERKKEERKRTITERDTPSVGPPSVGLSSVGPTSVGLSSVGPTSVGPTSVGLSSVGPTSVGLSSVGPTSVGLSSVGPSSVGPSSVAPHFASPTSVARPSASPTSVCPLSVGPSSVGTPSVSPTSFGPPFVIATSVDPSSASPTSVGTSSAGTFFVGLSSAGTSSAGTSSAGPSSVGTSSSGPSTLHSSSAGPLTSGPSTTGPSDHPIINLSDAQEQQDKLMELLQSTAHERDQSKEQVQKLCRKIHDLQVRIREERKKEEERETMTTKRDTPSAGPSSAGPSDRPVINLSDAQEQQDKLMELLQSTAHERDQSKKQVQKLTCQVHDLEVRMKEFSQGGVKRVLCHQACQTREMEGGEQSEGPEVSNPLAVQVKTLLQDLCSANSERETLRAQVQTMEDERGNLWSRCETLQRDVVALRKEKQEWEKEKQEIREKEKQEREEWEEWDRKNLRDRYSGW
ncbi:hypothetical protein DPEC_G00050310 [Dallia pectoralis]|uniref:Uncharacterized protein n=1 Tax=Dallia pectoralis TaxID=75939 RepID=A0ACC2HAY2_DALPE|nr:hypothetical protein DPEC_G00050310 [Dallia pectoralis]